MAESYKYLIIGGGASGTTAGETIRQKDSESSIAIVSDEAHALYSRVMLSKPNFFLEKIPFDQIFLKGDEWYKKNKITFINNETTISLDKANKVVTLSSGKKVSYEKLLVATGVRARPWNVPGADKKGVYSLRTLEDGKAIIDAIKTAKTAICIGGGFIGFEMADLMKLAGLDTTMLLRESYFWEPTLDRASGDMIEKALEKTGIIIKKNAEVAEVIGGNNVEGVILKDGTKMQCEIVIAGIGVIPASLDWLKEAGININKGIIANEYLETDTPNIWTAGDIAEYKDIILEESIQLGNWVNAREQGRIAALNMVGEKTPFKFVSFYTTQGVDINIAFIGDSRPLPDRIVIQRGSPEINSCARILIVGKELVGVTMINRTSELTSLAKIIEKNIDISEKYKELADPDFDLKSLLK
ncbi:MAG TPA: FAD-dependent oxidoreductase [Candidatus Paceibacterota bacterium]